MCHSVLSSASLFALLLEMDEAFAEEARGRDCPRCGGRLHVSNYERKPRGAGVPLGRRWRTRFSFCCATEGCRKRLTPPSARFLGRRVYVGAAVVVLATMRHGVTSRRLKQLRALFGVVRRTVKRWRRWWCERFPQTRCWKRAQGLLATPVDTTSLPEALLARMSGDDEKRLVGVLKLLRPLSSGAETARSSMVR